MTKQLSEKQKAKIREAIQHLDKAQQHLDKMNETLDQIVAEETRR